MEEFLSQFWPNFTGTIAGGVVLSILFFLSREWLFVLPQITGVWECELITRRTAYRPFDGMQLWYRVTLIQNGDQVSGFGERDRENSSTGARRYEGVDRRHVTISGNLEKRIFRSDRIHLLWCEDGEKRKFSNVFRLGVSGSKTRGKLWGSYASTAAESIGCSSWTRLG